MSKPSTPISGYVATGFEAVRDVFEKHFADGLELGAGFSVILNGEVCVDLCGGWADRKETIPWSTETLVPVYSTTKGIAAQIGRAHV